MMGAIGNILGGIAEAVGGIFKWKASPHKQYSDAEEIVEKKEAEMKSEKKRLEDAVYGGDEKAVNGFLNECLALACGLGVFACGCFSTPQPEVTRVPADRYVSAVTNDVGQVQYWKVPPLVMTELLDAKLELMEYKKKDKINERLMK